MTGSCSCRPSMNQPPVGLCGSGILDLVAQLRKAGLINAKGAFAGSDG